MHGKYKGRPLIKQADFILNEAQGLIVFTDLDGTLLDHYTYDYSPAKPALQLIRRLHIPLILTSSKTFDEIKQWVQRLELPYPFIFENGAGIAFPPQFSHLPEPNHRYGGYTIWHPGPDYAYIRQLLQQWQHLFRFQGFGDMSVETIAKHTGLSLNEAQAARRRMASEPLMWEDTPEKLTAFRQLLQQHHLQLIRGGRFYHVVGKNVDKGKAVRTIIQQYQKMEGFQRVSIGIGDSPNDLPLLNAVDIPIAVQRPDGSYMPDLPPNALHAPDVGPHGWNAAISQLLSFRINGQSHQSTGGLQ